MFYKNGMSLAVRCIRSTSCVGGRKFFATEPGREGGRLVDESDKKDFSIKRDNPEPLPVKFEKTLLPRLPDKPVTVEGRLDECWQINGVPEDHVVTRRARIFVAARAAPQQGNNNTKLWKVELDNRERWENQLMGWSSSGDPLSNISQQLDFASKEDAIRFCLRQGWEYEVEEPQVQKIKPKAYGTNFSWNKPTRVSTK